MRRRPPPPPPAPLPRVARERILFPSAALIEPDAEAPAEGGEEAGRPPGGDGGGSSPDDALPSSPPLGSASPAGVERDRRRRRRCRAGGERRLLLLLLLLGDGDGERLRALLRLGRRKRAARRLIGESSSSCDQAFFVVERQGPDVSTSVSRRCARLELAHEQFLLLAQLADTRLGSRTRALHDAERDLRFLELAGNVVCDSYVE